MTDPLIREIPEIRVNPQLDAIVVAAETESERRLEEIVPVLEAFGLHAHLGGVRARWTQDGDFFRKDEIRIHVESRYRICGEEHAT